VFLHREEGLQSNSSPVTKVAAGKGAIMQTNSNRSEPKAQALSWLVSQLRWEETLGELRHDRADEPVRRAA